MNDMNMNLFLIDIGNIGFTSGVDRYLDQFMACLGRNYPYIRIHRIRLVNDNRRIFCSEERNGSSTVITIPMPQHPDNILSEHYWDQKYNEQVYRLCNHLFENKEHCIIHIHTLNLIGLAVYIKKRISCKIITHLHCIPWKGLYNTDVPRFNRLYHSYYICRESGTDSSDYIQAPCEAESYHDADHVICITQGAEEFLVNTMRVPRDRVSVVYNGCEDWGKAPCPALHDEDDGTVRLIFVGVWNQSKGLEFILEAMRKVLSEGYRISLTIAGKYNSNQYQYIVGKYSDLSLNILGCIPFDRLSEYYRKSDIGVIASLQEQMSLVSLEMAMFGLPVITTATDGMDEIFTDGENAVKIYPRFSILSGLSVDTDTLAEKMINLAGNKKKRIDLGRKIRKLYEDKFTIETMTARTVEIYTRLLNQ